VHILAFVGVSAVTHVLSRDGQVTEKVYEALETGQIEQIVFDNTFENFMFSAAEILTYQFELGVIFHVLVVFHGYFVLVVQVFAIEQVIFELDDYA